MHKSKRYRLFALIWTCSIGWLSLANTGSLGGSIPIPHKDKVVHFIFYLVFVLLWMKSCLNPTKRLLSVVFFIAIGYGIGLEYLQYAFTQNRSADGWDVLANTLGAFIGCLFLKNKLEKTA